MDSKIGISFQNSQFYRNYNNIDFVILKFQKIKNDYNSSKTKYKNYIQQEIFQKIALNLSTKIDSNENKSESYALILNRKINICSNIKKYVKYSNNINKDFIESVKIGNIRNINILIENGADIHADDDYAIRCSSRNGHIEVVKFLVENGADIHANNDFSLRCSSFRGHIEVVKFLIEKGADIHADDDFAIKYSSGNGYIDVVKFLIQKGADIHAEDDYALRMSSDNGNIEVVKYLVENGANIHAKYDEALSRSGFFNQIELVKFLINSDVEYYCKNEIARDIVIEHNLTEFYEKFDIK